MKKCINFTISFSVANNVGRGGGCTIYENKDSSDEGDNEDVDEEEEQEIRERSSQKTRQELHVSVSNDAATSISGENRSPETIISPVVQDGKFGRGEGLLQCTTPQMGDQSLRR